MITRTILLLSLACVCRFALLGQQADSVVKLPFPQQPGGAMGGISCGTDALLQEWRKSAAFRLSEERMNQEILSAVRLLNDEVVLPVVFHILSDDPYAVPDKLILDGLEDLNDAFAKKGAWTGSKGVDTKIRFCLARKDPDGGNTTGITRVPTHWGNHVNRQIDDAKLKATAQWDPARFINIWYVPGINTEGLAEFQCGVWTRAGIAGYATMPPGGGPTDGIVITGFGLLLAHEMGHYLGLYHTFEGYCFNNNCALNGDRVCDTQPDGTYKVSPCNNPWNTCNTDTLSNYSNGNFTKDVPDPIDNIMDYGIPGCQFTFTQGQADRMHAVINTQRKGLLEPKCEVLCNENVYASFRSNNTNPVPGDEISFTNTSTGAVSYEWLVDGVRVATTANFRYTFNRTGRFRITLKAIKDNNCYGSHSEFVIVTCGVAARFYTDKQAIASKENIYQDTILFTNNSVGATDYKWLVGNDRGMAEQQISTGKDLRYMFATPAVYTIRLIASNGSCIDTTTIHRVSVADPTPDATVYTSAVHCYQQTKIRIEFFICNNSYDTIPANTPVSFYDADPRQAGAKKIGTTFFTPVPLLGNCCSWLYTHIVDVGSRGLNQIYIVVNDNGTTLPLQMPNTGVAEKDYNNNIQVSRNFQFRVIPIPVSAAMEPGDTIRLSAYGTTSAVSGFRWSTPENLSCTGCQSPNYVADTMRNTTKRVIATSQYGCFDTAYVNITVPPYNDFRIRIDDAECAGTDSLQVRFTVFNDFKRGVLPRGLTIRFFDANPFAAGAQPLLPAFTLRDTIFAREAPFSFRIKTKPDGLLYAVVNDSIGPVPVVLPRTGFEEKNYANNSSSFDYRRMRVAATPAAPVMEPGDTVTLTALASPGAGISYTWSSAAGMSCTACAETQYVADTTRRVTKQVIARNSFGCRDTAYVQIQVPPYHDFRMRVDEAECAGTDSLFVRFTLFNDFKRGVLPKGLTIRFYSGNPAAAGAQWLPPAFILPDTIAAREFGFSTRIKSMPSGTLYALINDSAGSPPVVFPNTWLEEKNYTNNSGTFAYTRLDVTATPLTGLIEPGDTIRLAANAAPGIIKSYTWSPAYNLSCTVCQFPDMIADTSSKKRVIAENSYGCRDTALLDVVIPPSDDFSVTIDDAACAAGDSMYVGFTIHNAFRRGVLPRGLTIRFYDRDPRQAGATELLPAFVLPRTLTNRTQSYSTRIRNSSSGKLYAVVNDSGTTKPLVLPNSKRLEKEYGNNVTEVNYAPEKLLLSPQDTTVMRGNGFSPIIVNNLDNPGSTRWESGVGYTLNCNTCASPRVTVMQSSHVPVTSVNRYGCVLRGELNVAILPPDFTLQIQRTECINNTTTRVAFSLCMNNGYDTVWKDIPVTFYEGEPGQGNAKVLRTVFVTPARQEGNCASYVHDITTPATHALYAAVNDQGIAATPGADPAFAETNSGNNVVHATGFRRFNVSILPADTTIGRDATVQLFTTAEGGNLQSVSWQLSPFLSCTDCFNPMVNPTYTDRYLVTGKNENQCTDTAWATVRTITVGDVHIPTGFTPDGDGLNDIFYIMASGRVKILKDFIVYTRYGDKVLELHNVPPNDPVFGWKGLIRGNQAPAGAYVYQVLAEFTDGKLASYKGTIVLVR